MPLDFRNRAACTGCGYDMRGAPTATCPECGWDTTRLHPRDAKSAEVVAFIVFVLGLVVALLFVRSAEIAWNAHRAGEIWQHEADELIVHACIIMACTIVAACHRRACALLAKLPRVCLSLILILALVFGACVAFAGAVYLVSVGTPSPR